MSRIITRRVVIKIIVICLLIPVFMLGINTHIAEAQDSLATDNYDGFNDYRPQDLPQLPLPRPTNVSASDGTYADKVRVSWTGSALLPADYYIVYRNTSNTTSGAISWNLGELYIHHYYDDTSATPGTTYYYWVKGCYTSGSECSDFSDSDSGYRAVPPIPPTGVSATDGTYTDKVRVNWTSSAGATYYKIFRNNVNSTLVATMIEDNDSESPYDDTTLIPLQGAYYYWVKACNVAGCSDFSSSDSGYRRLSPPTGVSASDGTFFDKIRVSWDTSYGATHYEIYRNESDTYTGAAWIEDNASESPYDDTSGVVEQGEIFYYFVIACNSVCCSECSSIDSGYKNILAPLPPSGVSASDGSYTSMVRVSWDSAATADYYKIYRNTSNTTSGATLLEEHDPESPYSDYSANPGEIYYYWVKACNMGGCSDYSSGNSGYRKISPPTGVVASDGTYTDKVLLSWDSATGATFYKIYRHTSDSYYFAAILEENEIEPPYDDTSADPGTIYYYWVKACSAVGCSYQSSCDAGYRAAPVIPSPPTGVSASDGTYTDKVLVSWNSASGATYYEIYRNTSDTTTGATMIEGEDSDSPYDDTGAVPGTTYYYWVKACNISGCSGYSGSDSGYRGQEGGVAPLTDFDGDGMADPAKFYPSTGAVWWLKSSTSSWDSAGLGSDSFDYVRYSDFDGDRKTDPGKFSLANGTVWYIKSSTDTWEGKYLGVDTYNYVGGNDFEGDGKSDPTKLLPNGAIWYLESSTGVWQGFWVGPEAFEYVAGSDFDGDGLSDPAKFIADPGVLWYWESSTSGWVGVYLGSDAYSYVSASDFDGDGVTDPAKYYASTGTVWWLKSTTGTWDAVYMGAGVYTFVGGNDFDGDGITDPAKWDPGSGILYWLKSSTSTWDSAAMGMDYYELVN